MNKKLLATIFALSASSASYATTFTSTSPVQGGSSTPSGISTIGGVVFDAVGINDVRVTSQLSASSLFNSTTSSGSGTYVPSNPFEIGTQTGFTSAITNQLGGGFKEIGVRFTLFDGDSAPNNFDDGDNILLVNGIDFGNWTSVATQNTNSDGSTFSSSGFGFANASLSTGWFSSIDSVLLSTLWSSIISSEAVKYELQDQDPDDNFYDFTQGLDSSLINVGQGPTTGGGGTNVPEPGVLALLSIGLLGFRLLKKKQS